MNNPEIQVIVLAAGKGTRMNISGAKVLQPIRGVPIIDHVLKNTDAVPNSESIVVVGFDKESVMQRLGMGRKYAVQEQQLGTAHAVMAAESLVTAPTVLIVNGDMPLVSTETLVALAALHAKSRAVVSLCTVRVPNFTNEHESFLSFGRIIRARDGSIKNIIEYKDALDTERKVTEVNAGIYAVHSTWLFDALHSIQNKNSQHEFYVTDIVALAVSSGETVSSLAIPCNQAYGINTQEQLALVERQLAY